MSVYHKIIEKMVYYCDCKHMNKPDIASLIKKTGFGENSSETNSKSMVRITLKKISLSYGRSTSEKRTFNSRLLKITSVLAVRPSIIKLGTACRANIQSQCWEIEFVCIRVTQFHDQTRRKCILF